MKFSWLLWLAWIAPAWSAQQGDGAERMLEKLERLRGGGELHAAERQAALTELESWSRTAPAGLARELVLVVLAREAGALERNLDPAALPQVLSPREARLTAELLADGPVRARAFFVALTTSEPDHKLGLLPGAYAAFLGEVEARRLAEAEELAQALYQAQPAPWSASSLSLLWTRLGKYEQAASVLAEQLELLRRVERECSARLLAATDQSSRAAILAERAQAERDLCHLLERRAVVQLGAGACEPATADLGRALALGGRDAAQILGQRALAAGQRDQALALFRSLLHPRASEDPEELATLAPWAWRGWGLAQLPDSSHSLPAPRPALAAGNPRSHLDY